MKTWFTVLNVASDTAEVRIYDDIGSHGVTAQQFCDSLNAIQAPKINLRINSFGGEVFDAAAMCTAIREHPAEITAHVDGIAASAASVVASACDSTQMGKSAFLMIHNPLVMAYGNAGELRKQADVLDKLADSIAQVYCDKTGKPKDAVLKAMDDESWFDAQEAKAWGLADVVKEDDDDDDDDDESGADNFTGSRAINSLAPLLIRKYKNVPDRIKRLATAGKQPRRTNEANMLKIIDRDGKHFVSIEGKDHEVDVPVATVIQTATIKPGKSDEEMTAAVNKAKEDAIREERTYRSMFNTIISSANLSGDAAAEFEKNFYGRAETDLKFLASHAIGKRATAVGEGSGEAEKGKADADKAKTEIRDYCAKRFANEARLRRQFGVAVSNPEDAGYKTGLEKFITVESKCRADEARKPVNQAEEPSDDPIGKLLKNKSVYH